MIRYSHGRVLEWFKTQEVFSWCPRQAVTNEYGGIWYKLRIEATEEVVVCTAYEYPHIHAVRFTLTGENYQYDGEVVCPDMEIFRTMYERFVRGDVRDVLISCLL